MNIITTDFTPPRIPSAFLPDGTASPTLKRRFLSRIFVPTGTECHLWGGRRKEHEGGLIQVNNKDIPVRRLAWIIANGPIPPGFHVRSTCRVPLCVNPLHLTLIDPTAPKVPAPKEKLPPKPRGKPSKFTPEDIQSIRHRRFVDGETYRSIAKTYDVVEPTIHAICTGKTHADVPFSPNHTPKQLP